MLEGWSKSVCRRNMITHLLNPAFSNMYRQNNEYIHQNRLQKTQWRIIDLSCSQITLHTFIHLPLCALQVHYICVCVCESRMIKPQVSSSSDDSHSFQSRPENKTKQRGEQSWLQALINSQISCYITEGCTCAEWEEYKTRVQGCSAAQGEITGSLLSPTVLSQTSAPTVFNEVSPAKPPPLTLEDISPDGGAAQALTHQSFTTLLQ